jgi:hypothetical protein
MIAASHDAHEKRSVSGSNAVLAASIGFSNPWRKRSIRPSGADALCLPLTQGCAALALGYFRRLPTGADRCAAHGMARTFSEDEYQACSGIGHGANKKTVVVERKDLAGAEQAAEKLRNSV